MQNKGAIRLFAILLALVSLYQLTFTYFTRKVEGEAKEFAKEKSKGNLELTSGYEYSYLDSISNETVYNFLWLRKYSYKECKNREINFGLDLKGGMNLILEVKVVDIVKALSNYNKDEKFLEAIKLAESREKNSSKNFVDLFGVAFKEVAPNGSLAAIFNTVELREKVKYDSSNDDVLKVLSEESTSAIDNAFNIIRTRIDRFGVTQPNVQKLQKNGQILIELPGITEPERVRKLLQGTASLEFWVTYDNQEIYQNLLQVNSLVAQIESDKTKPLSELVSEKTDSIAKTDTIADAAKEEVSLLKDLNTKADTTQAVTAKSLFAVLTPSGRPTGPVIGVASSRDTAKVNSYLNLEQAKALLPRDLRLMWTIKPLEADELQYWINNPKSKESYFQLVAIKSTSHDGRAPLEGDAVTNARMTTASNGSFEISMSMSSEGAKTWARLTKSNIKKSIAIVLDGYVYSFPTVQNEIKGGQSSITGNFTPEEAKDLANILKSGKLPAPARIVEDTVVGPSLGKEAVNAGLISFVWAFLAVLLYMILYYGFKAGAIADIALIFNMFFIMGVLASFGAVLTLPGIAGIVLTLGMAVDANVLIYERIREELRGGKGLNLAVTEGYKNAFSAIIDSNVTTFLTGLILFVFGTGPIKGFATTLMIGIATSFFTAVFISRLIFETLLKNKVEINFSTKFTENFLQNTKLRFIENRNLFFTISGALIIIFIGSLSIRGLKQGIDFSGGRSYVVRFNEAQSATSVQSSLVGSFDGANTEVKTFGSDNQVRITTNYLIETSDEATDLAVEKALYDGLKSYLGSNVSQEQFFDDYLMSSQKVGPTIASDIRNKAGLAIFFSLIVIFLYVLIRFRNWEFSVGAIAALVHDVIMVLGVYSLAYSIMPFSMEADQTFIAAILTIIGYSINDTVVVFDRIRENRGLYPKRNSLEVFNMSINSTLTRTLNTSFTTLLVLFVILFFGGEVIRGFVFALIVGISVGTYSSIFVASPISYLLLNRKTKKEVK